MDEALGALKNLRKGVKGLEYAMSLYAEFEPTDPHDTKQHPFKNQFFRTYQGMLHFLNFVKVDVPYIVVN